jgi:tetratricopeptide (TPR) repeat protein
LAYYNRGLLHCDLGNLQQALVDYTKAIELDPQYALAYYNRGLLHRDLTNLRQAIHDFEQVLALSTDRDLREKAKDKLLALHAVGGLMSFLSRRTRGKRKK